MKKSIFTVMTAAMFAAANLSAVPADAADNGGSSRPKVDPVETVTISDQNWNNKEEKGEQKVTTTTAAITTQELTRLTTTSIVTLYGPPWMFTTTTTTMPVLLYGPPLTTTTIDKELNESLMKLKGDVNDDQIIDTFDAIALRRAILFDEYKSERAKLLSDINSDGKIDVTDLVLLHRFLLGAIKDFKEYNSSGLSNKTTTKDKNKSTTTTTAAVVTTSYDPRSDIVVTLYGIKPSIDKIKEITGNAFDNIKEMAEAVEEEQQEDK
ncbi:MAG: dockerin type I repeat-containing protein [Ruminococcus sp.]|uniref:dockerin type I repeat-containing protein n=1 Tax=Ruminococcus sp. TaxID=41978 RepID=UPI0025F2E14D|nr:dockerin type I repeat-containing protein [Ruminococcus sp.]MBR5682868.1 dockerin type I repeat-containing protein [Ruminococcus sp.]